MRMLGFSPLDTGSCAGSCEHLMVSKISLASSTASDAPLPRLNLKKRSAHEEAEQASTGLHGVNSAFLSGLFADVAQAESVSDDEGLTVLPPPTKKSRSTLTRALSRCPKSFGNLQSFVATQDSDGYAASVTPTLKHGDSLLSQLHIVSSGSSTYSSTSTKSTSVGNLVFPRLSSTRDSSCPSLTRKISNPQLFETETNKESYGWFIETDDSEPASVSLVDPYKQNQSQSLAFSAATAPKASNYDAELEWATAADTVDDVLGDFF